ncbi:hypothetical protein CLOM_g23697 [Closterium sp. NIES-68]|nr:hypothetical protein CLOM_g23697 [Closterium sp. NIES-68]
MTGTAFSLLLLAVVACILPRTQSAFNTHPLLHECGEGSGALFNATWERGALAPGSVRWTPASDRFLLAFCVRGQITNRLLCLRNHMLLAGLLNRTLIVPFHRSETIFNYDLHLVVDLEYLRACLGPTVFSTAEFRRKFRRPIQVSQVVCWHGPPGACADQVDNILLHCPGREKMSRDEGRGGGAAGDANDTNDAGDANDTNDAGDGDGMARDDGSGGDAAGDAAANDGDGDADAAGDGDDAAGDDDGSEVPGSPGYVFDTGVPVFHALFRSQLSHLPPDTTTHAACLPMLASKEQVLRAFAGNPSPVLVVGDLLNLHMAPAHLNLHAADAHGGNGEMADGSAADGATVDGSTTDGPTVDGSTTDGPTVDGSTTDGPTVDGSTTDGPTVDGSTTDGPSAQPFLDLPFRRSSACPSPLLLRPRAPLLQAAERFVEHLFGERRFAAVHWRRGDFKPWCFWVGPKNACFYPIHQVAYWVVQRVRENGIGEMFLATNANLKELKELVLRLASMSPISITFYRLPPLTGNQNPNIVTFTNVTTGATVTITTTSTSTSTTTTTSSSTSSSTTDSSGRNDPALEGDNQSNEWLRPISSIISDSRNLVVVAPLLEKLICAQATVFYGSVGSTFSEDIQRFRHGLRTAHCNDTIICHGEKEWVRNRGR